MSLTPEIQELINRLQQELSELEQNTAAGLDLVRIPLSQFPENTILVQFFAYLSNVIFFIANYRQEINATSALISITEISNEEIQTAGERLSLMLGVVLETKIRVGNVVNRLGDEQ